MKLLVCLFPLLLSVLSVSLSVAQISSTVRPPATRPAPADTVSGRQTPASATTPNRRQELYDQYNSYSKKPAPPAPVSVPAASSVTPQQPPIAIGMAPADQIGTLSPASSDAEPSSIRIGIRGGVNYPVYTETNPLADPVIDFVGGLVLTVGAGLLSFQPEINYTRSSFNVVGSLKRSEDQIQVPLLLKISSGTYDGSRFFLTVGPYGSYVSSASLNGKKVSLDASAGRLSYGAAAGVGAALKAGPGHVTIEVRGYYQLGNNANPNGGATSIIPVQATLGYSFPLGIR